ncbi:MAG: DUF502 domain-containing protein [bacterium]|nr:DUF502 domain-containing protein [bacterium]
MIGFLRRNLLTGILAITPLALTLWVLWQLYGWIAGLLRPLLGRLPYVSEHYPEFALTLLGVAAFVPILVLLGLFTRNLAGRAFFGYLDRLFERIPLVKGLFNTFKQIAGVFGNGQGRSFKQVVLVRFPHPASLALAFVTRDEPDSDLVAVFLPTTPNPTSGFMLLIPRTDLQPLELTVEEAIKLVVSGGAIMTPAQARVLGAGRTGGGGE